MKQTYRLGALVRFCQSATSWLALSDVASLPPRTAIFLTTVFRDAAGETFFPEQVASLVAMSAAVPIYVLGDPMIGSGVVGRKVAHLATPMPRQKVCPDKFSRKGC